MRPVLNSKGFALIGIMTALALIPTAILISMQASDAVGKASQFFRSSQLQQNLTVVRDFIVSRALNPDNDSSYELLKEEAGNAVPASLPVNPADSYGTAYRYCTWDLGSPNSNSTYSQNAAAPPKAGLVGRIISAGKDKTFQTACSDVSIKGDDVAVDIADENVRYSNAGIGGWVDDGDSVKLLSLTDKVGIGVTAANHRLELAPGTTQEEGIALGDVGVFQSGSGLLAIAGSLQMGGETVIDTARNVTANNLTVSSGLVSLGNENANMIVWNGAGAGAPSNAMRSSGTKLVLAPTLSASSTDYAYGVESGALWSSVPTTSQSFVWYGGTSVAGQLAGDGTLRTLSWQPYGTASNDFFVDAEAGTRVLRTRTALGNIAVTGIHTGQGTFESGVNLNGGALQIGGVTVMGSDRSLQNVTSVSSSLNPTTTNSIDLGSSSLNQYRNLFVQNIYKNGEALLSAGDISGTPGAIARFTGTTSLGNSSLVDTGGLIGVNEVTPLEALDVNGRIRIQQSTAPGTTTDRLYNVGGNLHWGGSKIWTDGSLTAGTGIDITGFTITNIGVTSLTGTANQVNVSDSSGAVTLSLPQSIHTGASPSFASINLGNTSNQLVMGAGITGTLTWSPATSSKVITLPNATGTVITTGNLSSITGTGTISSGTWQGATIGAAYGGTGLSSYTIGDLIYASGATTLSKLADVATGNVLLSGGVGTAPTWGKVILATHVSGTLGVANGGTGLTAAPNNGQLLIGNGTGYALAGLTAGTGIDVTNGAGSITISNTGVTSLSGTANQVNVSGATGAVTLSLPQNIHTAATPTFAGMTLNGNLVLGVNTLTTTNTGLVTNLNADRVDGYHAGNGASNLLVLDASGLVPIADLPIITTAKGGTGLTSAGTAGNLLRSDGTNWTSWTPNFLTGETDTLATVTGRGNSTAAGIALTENGNLAASYALYLKRNTDTSPLGYLIQAQNAAGAANLFTVDVNGNVTANQFNGSGAGLSAGTVPIASLVAGDYSGKITSGTYSIDITGNAATVTNGVYTTGSYADPAWITSLAKSKVGLGNVENTALSTWAGSTNITTLGTITTGTWNGTAIGVGKGGTGLTATPTNGQILIGNGTGYTLAGLTAGTGIGVANGAGTITISNTGVTSLSGTANQVNVSGATGAVTLSLPQNIHTAATPTFAGMTLNGNLVLGANTLTTTNTGLVTNLNADRVDGYHAGNGASNLLVLDASGLVPIADLPTITTAKGGTGLTSAGTAGNLLRSDGTNWTSWTPNFLTGETDTLATVTGRGNSTAAGIALTENGNLAASYALYLKRNTDTSPLGYLIQAQNAAGAANLFTVDVNGNVTANQFNGSGAGLSAGTVPIASLVAGDYSGKITSGTYSISITGNAATVTNGVYTTGSYADPAWITSLAKSKVGLGNVENTALSTWAGSTNITTLGTITTGTWNGTAIGVNKGGTGLTSYAVGDLIYASGATTLARLADVATGNVLLSGGVGVAPSWGKVGLATHVSGTLGVANGGTGLTATPTNGQLLIGNGTGYTLANLTAGSNVTITNGAGAITISANVGAVTHSALGGLSNDDHLQYALLNGRAGGQILIGGTAANNTLILQGNSAASGNTSTAAGIQFRVGNSGSINALTIFNNGNVETSGAVTIGGGQLNLANATSNAIVWGTSGLNVPTAGSRSVGTKLVLYPVANNPEYAVGVSAGSLWHSVPDNTAAFKWYHGTVATMTLSSDTSNNSTLEVTGGFKAPNFNATPGDNYGLRFWGDDTYKIYMSSAVSTYGGRLDATSDYNIYFRIGNSGGSNRGFVFRAGDYGGSVVAQIDGGGNFYLTGSVVGAGSSSTYGAITVQGGKNGWSGISFRASDGTLTGTLMARSDGYFGWYNPTDDGWRFQVDQGGNLIIPGTITASGYTPTNWNTAYTHSSDVSGNVHGATSANNANMIVRRDVSGGFAAGAVTTTSVTNPVYAP